MKAAELKVDGNAVAGLLADVFGAEMTAAVGTCAACGEVAALGAVDVYLHAPGVVLRCRACQNVVACIVTRANVHCVSVMGLARLQTRS